MRAKFVVTPVWTSVFSDDRFVHTLIDDTLSVMADGYRFSKAYRMGVWDGKKRFYDSIRRRFLTGFLFRVLEKLYDKKVEVQVEGDGYMMGVDEVADVDNLSLNGVDEERWKRTQLPVLKKMMQMKRCSVRMATGSGKTEVVAGLCKAVQDKTVLVLVHRIELLEQTINRIGDRIGESVGVIGSGSMVDLKRVNVGMVQSVWNKLPVIGSWLKNEVDVLVIDECHHTGAETWVKISMACGARWRYGLSGTPITKNQVRDMYLIGLTGEPLMGVGVSELVEMGYAVKPVVRLIVVPDIVEKVGSWWEVYQKVYGSERLLGVLERIVELHKRKNLVVFVERVGHGRMISKFLREKGYKVVFTHGGLENWKRVKVVENMRSGKYDVVVATTIFDEGIDVPAISGVVFWCSSKSVVRVLQRIGRSLRVEEGKECSYIYDFVIDNKYLKRHLKERVKVYEKEGISGEGYLYNHKEGELVKIEVGGGK